MSQFEKDEVESVVVVVAVLRHVAFAACKKLSDTENCSAAQLSVPMPLIKTVPLDQAHCHTRRRNGVWLSVLQ